MNKKDVVDNTSVKMSQVLNDNIRHAESIDISTGYFDMHGYHTVRAELESRASDPSFTFRMLMGADALVRPAGFEKLRDAYGTEVEREVFQHVAQYDDDVLPFKERLDNQTLNAMGFDDINGLIKFLERKNTQVRLGSRKFNHAKCYIFRETLSSFVGSSNFTGAGLEKNDELNAGLYQPASIDLTKDWFERVWKKGSDAKQDLITTLKQSKFGVPSEPYDVYMKMLFEEYREFIDARADTTTSKELAKFQLDAVKNVKHMLTKFGGAIIADSTGLGKTNMGIEILRQKNDENKKILIVAPAQVLDSMWRVKLYDAQLHPMLVSMEHLSRMDVPTLQKQYRNVSFVLIDESQNFRNKNSNRRKNLMRLIHGIGKKKQVVMLSATPINNSIMDLYYQLSIITNEDEAFFHEATGIRDLYKHMRDAADKDNLSQGLAQIQYLLGKIMVRRTRSHIRESYPNDLINNKPLVFPEHKHGPIKYSLSDIFGNIYNNIIQNLEKMVGTPYCVEYYDKTRDSYERNKLAGLGKIQTIFLLKRFESSTEAARISLANKIKLYTRFQHMLKKNEILRPKDFNKIMYKWNRYINDFDSDGDEGMIDEDEFFIRELSKVETETPMSYDVEKMKSDLEDDLKILQEIRHEVEKVRPEFDKKFEAVRDMIQKDRALEHEVGKRSGKVLVFSEYKPTAKYVAERLASTFKNKRVKLIDGDTKKEMRQKIIEAFAPRSNPTDEPPAECEVDILVSTEVMSEGQNLQDCNYVINYDLPWNPMRLVQRAGRVDRLTSEYDTVLSRACYPDKELDGLLNLKARLIHKVQVVNDVIGIDSPLMGELPKHKQYTGISEVLRNLARGENTDVIMDRFQEESDLMGSTLLGEITKYVNNIGINKMHNEPMGRRSGKVWDSQKAVLSYLTTSPRTVYFVVYDYKTRTAVVAVNPDDAIRMIQCMPGDNIHLPMDSSDHRASFIDLIEIDRVATNTIRSWQEEVNSYRAQNIVRRRNSHERNLVNLKNSLKDAVKDGMIDGDKAGNIMDAARSNLRVWQDELKIILENYNQDKDLDGMIAAIISIMGRVERKDVQSTSVDHSSKPPRLKLIGAMFLSENAWNKHL